MQGGRGLHLGGAGTGTGFPFGGFPQAITVLDEEIDEGGWESSLHHKRSAAFGGLVEVGNQPGDTSNFGFLPRKRHGTKKNQNLKKEKNKTGSFLFFSFLFFPSWLLS